LELIKRARKRLNRNDISAITTAAKQLPVRSTLSANIKNKRDLPFLQNPGPRGGTVSDEIEADAMECGTKGAFQHRHTTRTFLGRVLMSDYLYQLGVLQARWVKTERVRAGGRFSLCGCGRRAPEPPGPFRACSVRVCRATGSRGSSRRLAKRTAHSAFALAQPDLVGLGISVVVW